MGKLLRVVKDFSGGLSEVANDNMADNQLSEAQNAIPGETFGISRATGTNIYTRIAEGLTVKRIIEGQFMVSESLVIQTLAFVENGDGDELLYKKTSDGWTQLTATNFNGAKSLFHHANKLYWLDGSNLWSYDGTALAPLTASDCGMTTSEQIAYFDKIKTSSFAVQRGQRWFYCHGGSEILFSNVGSPISFTITNILNANTSDGDTITALHVFNDDLLIFKEHSVFKLSGWDFSGGSDINLSRMNVTTGTRYPDSIRTIQNGVLFLGNNGIYRLYVPYYNSYIATQNISDKAISKRLFADGLPDRVVATVWNNVYYIAVRHGDATEEYRYYIDSKAFWGPFTQKVRCYAPALEGADKLFVGCDNGYVLYYDDGSTHYIDLITGTNAPIPMVVKTKGYDVVGATFQDAKVKRLLIAAKQYATDSSDLAIQIKADYADEAHSAHVDSEQTIIDALDSHSIGFDESLVWEEGYWLYERWGWTDTVVKQIPLGRKTKHCQFILKSVEAQPLTIYALGMLYKRKKVKGNGDGVEVIDIDD